MPTVILLPKESEDFFYDALCNAVGTGYMQSYGIELIFNNDDYRTARKNLIAGGTMKAEDICMEDVWMQILRDGKKLTFADIEGDGENTKSITMKEVHERVQKMPLNHLNDMVEENGDAITADVLLQTVFFEKIIFG